MTRQPSRPKLNAQILDEAAQWFIELEEDVDPSQRRAFDEWLRRSPEHVRAFLELVPLWEQAGAPSSARKYDPEQLLAMARGAGAEVTPIASAVTAGPRRDTQEPKRKPAAPRWPFAAAAMVVVSVVMLVWWRSVAVQVYSTGLAEHRSVVLSDGSTIELNARSKLRVRFSAGERSIDLVDGQVLFRVAKDASRPFVVRSEGARVQAIGTEFDVYRKKGKLTVTVIEGRVSVYPDAIAMPSTTAPGAGATVLLSAGEQTSVVDRAVEKPTPTNVAVATAWTQRRLVFQKAPLVDVVDEFNRYNPKQLRIEDAGIESFLVSGTFSSTDPGSLLRFLREQPGMRIHDEGDVIRIVAAP
ncbi:FecR family protein [Steroidobacter sp.]|uniref:FecR family protein n=1 Tax=Steroidobacter sp. TaxID=1978227 RepID=UPI001A37B017|nr:FecR domain-containing protein [Steroidobacter sp.]MBL8268154.1 FecR domain-containing protein [Steroidobacter sp.]